MTIQDWLKHFENIWETMPICTYSATLEESNVVKINERFDYFAFHDWAEENESEYLPIAKMLLNEIIYLDKVLYQEKEIYIVFIKFNSFLIEFMKINTEMFGYYNKNKCYALNYPIAFKIILNSLNVHKEITNSIKG